MRGKRIHRDTQVNFVGDWGFINICFDTRYENTVNERNETGLFESCSFKKHLSKIINRH